MNTGAGKGRRYPPEVRARVAELLKAGRSRSEVAREVGVSPYFVFTVTRETANAGRETP